MLYLSISTLIIGTSGLTTAFHKDNTIMAVINTITIVFSIVTIILYANG